MMNITELKNAILTQFEGATMVRNGKAKTNFIAIPVGENEDGVMEYAKVAVSALLSKDTKTNPAFNFETAKSEYDAYAAVQAEKAAKPKAAKKSGADPEKVAAMNARKEAVLSWLIANPGEYTSSDIKASLPEVYEGFVGPMQVGTDLKSLMNDGSVVCEVKEGKKYWHFAE